MTSAEDQTVAALLASSVLAGLVGDRITPDEIDEESQMPALQYERGDTQPEYGLDGTLFAARVTITITIWAKTRSTASAVSTAVVNAMHAHFHEQSARGAGYEPELREYASVLNFDVWEI